MAPFSLGTEEMFSVVSLFFMKFQAYSIGLKSGESTGQSVPSNGLSFKKSSILLEVWKGGAIVQKVGAAMHHYKGQELIFRDLLVFFYIHCQGKDKEKRAQII